MQMPSATRIRARCVALPADARRRSLRTAILSVHPAQLLPATGSPNMACSTYALLRHKECISRESNPGHIDGNDVFYH